MRNIRNDSVDWTALAERSNLLAFRSDPLRIGRIMQDAIYPPPDGFKFRTAKAASFQLERRRDESTGRTLDSVQALLTKREMCLSAPSDMWRQEDRASLYSVTKGQQAICETAGAMRNRTDNLSPFPAIYPDYPVQSFEISNQCAN